MKIPKYPDVPELTVEQISEITEICFLDEHIVHNQPACDAIFIFGGSHPGCWEAPIEAYRSHLGKDVIVTGDSSIHGIYHPDWTYGDRPTTDVIIERLLESGVAHHDIYSENKSKHSIENVTKAMEIYDFAKINSLLFICKSYAAGRQLRTLSRYLPDHISFIPYPFDTNFSDDEPLMTRDNWMDSPQNKALVFGEYLRNICYGKLGGITAPKAEVGGLEKYVAQYVR